MNEGPTSAKGSENSHAWYFGGLGPCLTPGRILKLRGFILLCILQMKLCSYLRDGHDCSIRVNDSY